jgi:hypothetical protein
MHRIAVTFRDQNPLTLRQETRKMNSLSQSIWVKLSVPGTLDPRSMIPCLRAARPGETKTHEMHELCNANVM